VGEKAWEMVFALLVAFLCGSILTARCSVYRPRYEELEAEYCALALSTANSLTDSLAVAASHEYCEWWKSGPEMMEERK